MILHFSHIGLTDGLTFMIPFGWSGDQALAAVAAAATWAWMSSRARQNGSRSSRTQDGSKSALASTRGTEVRAGKHRGTADRSERPGGCLRIGRSGRGDGALVRR